jgi:hypothetical protein
MLREFVQKRGLNYRIEAEYYARLAWLIQREIITRDEMEDMKQTFKVCQLLQ